MDSLIFSVIIPIYNTPKTYLDCCIKSLLSQTFEKYEIILVDDGSQAMCGKLCDEFANADSRIHVIHQQNQGVSVARNTGIQAARADWIVFVDADDWLESDALERLNIYLAKNNCDILVFNAVKEYVNKQKSLNYGLEPGRMYSTTDVKTREMLYRRTMQTPDKHCPIYYSWDKVFKRAFLIENDLRYPVGIPKSEDKVFVLSCLEKLEKLYYVDDVLYHYRINADSVCNRYSENADADRVALASVLQSIAKRMDSELAQLTGKQDYNQITKDYYRFVFGIISDVLFLKFYHPDNPQNKRVRAIAARQFICSEPFRTSIAMCRYAELSPEAKMKKFLLGIGLVTLFCDIRKVYLRVTKRIATKSVG